MKAVRSLLILIASLVAVSAFTTPQTKRTVANPAVVAKAEPLFLFNKPPPQEDLSDIEVRDMTRDEMKALNAENERVMNAELWGMTIFSLILSVPMLYLVWVGFFSETSEMNIDI